MKNPPVELTPEQTERVFERWQRMSRLGFVPFVTLVGGGLFMFISLFSFVNEWLTLRAHHLSYPWSAEACGESLAFRSIMLVSTCGIAVIYWFSTKRIAIRSRPKPSNASTDHFTP
jgi:hypothetical protein